MRRGRRDVEPAWRGGRSLAPKANGFCSEALPKALDALEALEALEGGLTRESRMSSSL
jgi:hypothetical protein